MNNKDNGGPAFPATRENFHQFDPRLNGGMTLRDYFAAKAMQGYWSDSRFPQIGLNELARHCYAMADAMLEHGNERLDQVRR